MAWIRLHKKGVKIMLRHKFMNERTVTFDDKVYNDLELLADVTGRTREELIHKAAINLIEENKEYFTEYILSLIHI